MSWAEYVLLGTVIVACVPVLVGSVRGQLSERTMLFSIAGLHCGAVGFAIVTALKGDLLPLVPMVGLIPMGVMANIAIWLSKKSRGLEGEALLEMEKLRARVNTWLVRLILLSFVLLIITLFSTVLLKLLG